MGLPVRPVLTVLRAAFARPSFFFLAALDRVVVPVFAGDFFADTFLPFLAVFRVGALLFAALAATFFLTEPVFFFPALDFKPLFTRDLAAEVGFFRFLDWVRFFEAMS